MKNESLKNKDFHEINTYRKDLLKNKEIVSVNFIGEISRIIKKKKSTIRKIARVAGTSPAKGKVLHKLIKYYQPVNIVELGTSLGIGTFYLHAGNKNAHVFSIEGNIEVQQFAIQFFNSLNKKNIKFINKIFDDSLEPLLSGLKGKTVLFIDGNHKFEATLKYFELCMKHCVEGSVIIIDDINWSREMKHAWEKIKIYPGVGTSVDMFYLGYVEKGEANIGSYYIHM